MMGELKQSRASPLACSERGRRGGVHALFIGSWVDRGSGCRGHEVDDDEFASKDNNSGAALLRIDGNGEGGVVREPVEPCGNVLKHVQGDCFQVVVLWVVANHCNTTMSKEANEVKG